MSTHPDGDTAPAAPGHLDAATVLDVRSAAEFETTHIPGSINVPLPVLEAHADAIAARIDGPVLLVCNSGVRASQAQRHLAAAGVTNTSALHGGIGAHQAAGGELVHGRARWALERRFASSPAHWCWSGSALDSGFRRCGCSLPESAPG